MYYKRLFSFAAACCGLFSILFIWSSDSIYWNVIEHYSPIAMNISDPILEINEFHGQVPRKLKVLSWNIHYLTGNEGKRFFYEGGTDHWPKDVTYNYYAQQVVNKITELKPDILLLRGVDFGSVFTNGFDQEEYIHMNLPEYSYRTCAHSLKSAFMPNSNVWGPVAQGACIFSRYPLQNSKRTVLPAINARSFLTRHYFYHHFKLSVDIVIDKDTVLTVQTPDKERGEYKTSFKSAHLVSVSKKELGANYKPLSKYLPLIYNIAM